MKQWWERNRPGREKAIVLAGIIGILLLALSSIPAGKKEKQEIPARPSAEEYVRQTEERLETILGQIQGVGKVKVMVTLESGYRYVYARQEKTNSDRLTDHRSEEEQKLQEKNTREESYVLIDAGQGRAPLVTEEISPKIRGVVVVCGGGKNPAVAASVVDTVRVALNLSSAMISVSAMG